MKDADNYSPEEAALRRDAIIKNMIATPPTPHVPRKAKSTPSRPRRATRKLGKSA